MCSNFHVVNGRCVVLQNILSLVINGVQDIKCGLFGGHIDGAMKSGVLQHKSSTVSISIVLMKCKELTAHE